MVIPSCASHVLHTHDVINDVAMSKSKLNLNIPITWSGLSWEQILELDNFSNELCHQLVPLMKK